MRFGHVNPIQPFDHPVGLDGCRSCGSGEKGEGKGKGKEGVEVTLRGAQTMTCGSKESGKRRHRTCRATNDQICTCETKNGVSKHAQRASVIFF